MNSSTIQVSTRFRRRLASVFVLNTAVAAGLLVIGSFLFVQHQRYETFHQRAETQARLALALAQGEASAGRLDALVAVSRERNAFETLVVADQTLSSRADLTVEDIPGELDVDAESSDQLQTATTRLGSESYFVVSGDVPGREREARIHMFFAETELRSGLTQLRNVLFFGWFAVSLGSAAVGTVIARRTLRPINEASEAARALTEGLLDTRITNVTNDEFGDWARTFNEMAAALENKIEELSQAHERERRFTADIAHDLRTPLGAMVTSASLLMDHFDQLPELAQRPARLLSDDVDRLRGLVMNLLELGRLDAGQEKPAFESVDLCESIAALIDANHWEAEVRMQCTRVPVIVDRLRVERIMFNLISNAVQHGEGPIDVNVDVQAGALHLWVRDCGPGIPPEHMNEIFHRFHKESSSRSGEGSGLGLAIVARHVDLLGGTIDVMNVDGGGAQFHVHLPLPPGDTAVT